MKTVELLQGMRDLLSDESRWTTHSGARDAKGEPVSVDDPAAVAWCVYGAAEKLSGYGGYDAVDQLLINASTELYDTHMVATYVNDVLGYDAVIKLLDAAIEDAQEAN